MSSGRAVGDDRGAASPLTGRSANRRAPAPTPSSSAPSPAGAIGLQRLVGNGARQGALVGRLLQVQRQPIAPPAKPTLRTGSRGQFVKEAQRKLSRLQASVGPLVEDGQFGALTEGSVRTFQGTRGIPPTGVLDGTAWTALDGAFAALPAPVRAVLVPGADHVDVGFAQQKLNALGISPRLVVNAVYGPEMQPAIIAIEALVLHRWPTSRIDADVWRVLDTASPGGFIALEGLSASPIEQHTASGTANPLGVQVPGTSLHPVVGAGGILRGAAVRELQQKLNTAGASPALAVDGRFGPLTTAAVRAFQTGRVPPLPASGIADAATWTALDAVAPASTVGFIERQWREEVGGATYGNTGGNASRYSWEIDGDRMVVTVAVNFTGLAPRAVWFSHVPRVWDRFAAVRDVPPRRVNLEFRLVRGSGPAAMTVDVRAGTGRSNAGRWFRNDPTSESTVPHEFGHLIGLQDEYQQRPGDYVRITGHEPPVGATTGPAGVAPATIAANLQAAMLARNAANARTAAAGVTMGAFAQRVVAAYAALPLGGIAPALPAVPASPGVPALPALPAYTLTTDLVTDLDRSLRGTADRYETIQVFTYTSGSIMGDPRRAPDIHDHGAEPRHIAEFLGILGRTLGGTFRGEER
ncbi:peptidoglycan-binding domain-containing protein [Agromyces binzhouensis]|uniref:Peptidoglycan-binding protein n=1 Tax=Agromyces binzhouensis TaxID=1817495 RepID=A0A4Q2JTI2_9MICO|nr:peptidoglycan-binding protein [Agromyces binzhouensis]RXZ49847.1 peptidoglycan-binding protein [Agromyces binzhouensis]